MANSTRLRFVASKDLGLITRWVESLPFKIEIKGNPVKDKGKWYLFFNLPEEENPTFKKLITGDLD